MTALFLLSALFVIYTYALFPLMLHARARKQALVVPEIPSTWPSVSIVIAAHNEADSLPGKLESLAALDYPPELVELIIVSDGSTDNTYPFLQSQFEAHPDRHVKHLPESLGKCGALNAGVAMATGSIICFMDARQKVSANALKALVPYLSIDEIGAVSGELVLTDENSLEAANFGLYWRYEKWIRDNESRLYSTTGATGALYAMARSKRTLFIAGAYAFDKANDDLNLEFRRKVRNLAGNWQSYLTNSWLLNPKKNPVWWQFLSHKLFRLLVPFALIIAFVTAAFGEGVFLKTMFGLQLVFYAIALASHHNIPGTRNKVCNLVGVFTQLNAAAFVATVRFFSSKKAISWR